MAPRKYFNMSVEDYLILNKNSKDARYEYLDGEKRPEKVKYPVSQEKTLTSKESSRNNIII